MWRTLKLMRVLVIVRAIIVSSFSASMVSRLYAQISMERSSSISRKLYRTALGVITSEWNTVMGAVHRLYALTEDGEVE